MDLRKIIDVKKSNLGGYEIETGIGTMLISLRKNHLFCNFLGGELKAKDIFGHWKVNKFVYTEQDIKDHIGHINKKIEQSKLI